MEHLQQIITSRTPDDWIEDQLADIEAKRSACATSVMAAAPLK